MKMQVFINNSWDYVFCLNASLKNPVITKDRKKAISWHSHSIAYFTNKFANLKFRGI